MATCREQPNDMTAAIEMVTPRITLLQIINAERKPLYNGSGFLVEADMVITSKHLVSDKQEDHIIKVSTDKGLFYGEIEYLDTPWDLALIKIPYLGIKPVEFGSTIDIKPGLEVVCLGCPKKIMAYATQGIITCKPRASNSVEGIVYIQYDAATVPGSSGSALINKKGQVLGVHTYSAGNGFGYGITAECVDQFIKSWKLNKVQKGLGSRPIEICGFNRYVGFCLVRVPEEVFEYHRENHEIPYVYGNPLEVSNLKRGSPADIAGFKNGDLIVCVNGHMVQDLYDVNLHMKNEEDRFNLFRGEDLITLILP